MDPDRMDVVLEQQAPGWRLTRSLWIAAVLLGAGVFSWVGWVWAGAVAKSRTVWRIVLGWLVVTVLMYVFIVWSGSGEQTREPWNTLGLVTLLVTWFGGTGHAVYLRRRVLRDALIYRERLGLAAATPAAAPAPVAAPRSPAPGTGRPAPSATTLRERLQRLTADVRRDTRLPDDVKTAYERLAVGLSSLVDRVTAPGTDPDSRWVVGRMIEEYVPQSLAAYVALPAGIATGHRLESGRTAHEELLRQLDIMAGEIERVAVAVYTGDAQALATQTRFLEDRFAESSLRLPSQG